MSAKFEIPIISDGLLRKIVKKNLNAKDLLFNKAIVIIDERKKLKIRFTTKIQCLNIIVFQKIAQFKALHFLQIRLTDLMNNANKNNNKSNNKNKQTLV